MGATTGETLGTIAVTSEASQRETVVTACECFRTCRRRGLAKGLVRASLTSLPCMVVTRGMFPSAAAQVPTSPPGNHQCA